MKKIKLAVICLLSALMFIGFSAFKNSKLPVTDDPALVTSGFTKNKSHILVMIYTEEHSKNHGIIDADRHIRMKINKNLRESFKTYYTGDYDFIIQNKDVISDENGSRIINPAFADSVKYRYFFYIEETQIYDSGLGGDRSDCYLRLYDLKDKKKYSVKGRPTATSAGAISKYVEKLEEARAK